MTDGIQTMRHETTDIFAVAAKLVAWKREQAGVTTSEARKLVAREAKIAPGALERLTARRLKCVDRIAGALNAVLVRTIERKITELEHELYLAKSRSVPSIDVDAVDAALSAARKALGRG